MDICVFYYDLDAPFDLAVCSVKQTHVFYIVLINFTSEDDKINLKTCLKNKHLLIHPISYESIFIWCSYVIEIHL